MNIKRLFRILCPTRSSNLKPSPPRWNNGRGSKSEVDGNLRRADASSGPHRTRRLFALPAVRDTRPRFGAPCGSVLVCICLITISVLLLRRHTLKWPLGSKCLALLKMRVRSRAPCRRRPCTISRSTKASTGRARRRGYVFMFVLSHN